MADNSVVQTIKDAEIDARSLSEFVSKGPTFTVTRRLAPTIHTLDYYLLVLNRVKEKGDLADIAISDTLDRLEQLEPTVIQRVEDAINNTAIEGGVLADTFVTVTANGAGTVARTQRDKNTDSVHIKDFGAKGDGIHNDSFAFLEAFKQGVAVHSDPNSVHLLDRVFVAKLGTMDDRDKRYSNHVEANANVDSVYFNGNGCKILHDAKLNESYGYGAGSPRTVGYGGSSTFIINGFNSVVLKNFNIEGPLFADIYNDCKPMKKGDPSAHGGYNTLASGITIANSFNVNLDSINIYEIREGLTLVKCEDIKVSSVLVEHSYSAYGFIDCTLGEFTKIRHKHARWQLTDSNAGLEPVYGDVVDANGDVLYQIFPNRDGQIRRPRGHGIVIHGGSNLVFYDCSGYGAHSDCFRVQGSLFFEESLAENITTYNYMSERCQRYALAIYGPSKNVVHNSPSVIDLGFIEGAVEPPATLAEAMQGVHNPWDHWSLNPKYGAYGPLAAIISRHDGMTVNNLYYRDRPLDVDSSERFIKDYRGRQYVSIMYTLIHGDTGSITLRGADIRFNNLSYMNKVAEDPYPSQNGHLVLIAGGEHVGENALRIDIQDSYISLGGGVPVRTSTTDYMVRNTASNINITLSNCVFDIKGEGLKLFGGATTPVSTVSLATFQGCTFRGDAVITSTTLLVNDKDNYVHYKSCSFEKPPLADRTNIGQSNSVLYEDCDKFAETIPNSEGVMQRAIYNPIIYKDGFIYVYHSIVSSGTLFRLPSHTKLVDISYPHEVYSNQPVYDGEYFNITAPYVSLDNNGVGYTEIADIQTANGSEAKLLVECTPIADSDGVDAKIAVSTSAANMVMLLKFKVLDTSINSNDLLALTRRS